jgi:poly(beta-D-mannuronate) lyase
MGPLNNNHLYWGAAAVAATSIASGDKASLDWAIAAARRGLDSVGADGSLPSEMRRGPRALNYHAFALEPLVQIAGFAKANGIDLYSENDHALARLVAFVVRNLDDQTQVTKLAGGEAQILDAPRTDMLSWMEQYYANTGDCDIGRRIGATSGLSKAYLGGDTHLLYGGRSVDNCRQGN